MAVDYQGFPTIAPQTNAGNDYVNAQPNMGAAEAPGIAARGFGQAGEQFGQLLGQHAVAVQGIANENMANEARNNMVYQISQEQENFKQLEGKDAVAGQAAHVQKLKDIFQSTMTSLPNPEAQKLFASVGSRYLDYGLMGAAAWAGEQGRVWTRRTAAANVETDINTLSAAQTPEQIQTFENTIAANTRNQGAVEGWDQSTIDNQIRKNLGQAYQDKIRTLSATDPVAAKNLLDAVSNKIDARTASALTDWLQPKVDTRTGQQAGQRALMSEGGAAGALAGGAEPIDALWYGTKMAESGNNQFAGPGGSVTRNGNAIGISQIMPGTAQAAAARLGVPYDPERLKTDAAYNEALGRNEIEHLHTLYPDDPQKVSAAYNAGPGAVDKAVSQYGADWLAHMPEETQAYVPRVMQKAGIGASSPVGEDGFSRAYNKLANDDSLSDRQRDAGLAYISQQKHQFEMASAGARADLQGRIENATQALSDGRTDVSVPSPEQISKYFSPQESSKLQASIDQARTYGQLSTFIGGADPAAINAKRAELQGKLNDANSPTYAADASTLDTFNKAVVDRDKVLTSNPAGYVATQNPSMAATSDKPQDIQAAALASTAEQRRLGVAEPSVLTNAQAQSMAAQISRADPATTDVGAVVAHIGQQYGPYATQVWADLAQKGKLSPEWQTLGQIENPTDRTTFQQALQYAQSKGGLTNMRKMLPEGAAKDIQNALAPAIDDLAHSLVLPGVTTNFTTLEQQRSAIELMATSNVLTRGMSGQAAVTAAQTAILGAHDFVPNRSDSGVVLRTPKGLGEQVTAATDTAQAALKPGDLMPLQLPIAGRLQAVEALTAARSGIWFTNPVGDGATLYGKLTPAQGGGYVPIQKIDGKPVTVRFGDAARQQVAPPAPWQPSMP